MCPYDYELMNFLLGFLMPGTILITQTHWLGGNNKSKLYYVYKGDRECFPVCQYLPSFVA